MNETDSSNTIMKETKNLAMYQQQQRKRRITKLPNFVAIKSNKTNSQMSILFFPRKHRDCLNKDYLK